METIKKGIKKVLNSNRKLDLFVRAVLFSPERLTDYIIKTEKKDLFCRMESLGDLNDHKIVYYIEYTSIAGFGAVLRALIEAFRFADRYGFFPVVFWPHDYCFYSEKPQVSVNGSTNPFEYFFLQPTGITVEEALSSKNVLRFVGQHRDFIRGRDEDLYSAYRLPNEEISELGVIARQYLKVKPEIQYEWKRALEQLKFNPERAVAVHIRGGDFYAGFNGHPQYVPIEEYVARIKDAFGNGLFETIFLATDDEHVKEEMKRIFGNKLFYYEDVMRTSDNIGIHEHTDLVGEEGKYCRYRLGYEVLRDIYTMSMCGGMIAGLSQVSLCTRILNAGYDVKYRYIKIMDRGVYHSKKVAREDYLKEVIRSTK